MEVESMSIDPREAREKLRAYRARRHKDAEAQYAKAEKLYEAAAGGASLIVAGEAILSAGFDGLHRPRLAISRADRQQVCLVRRYETIFFDSQVNVGSAHSPQLVHEYGTPRCNAWKRWYATVPMVPPEARPPTGQLREWHILWEVDHWSDRPIIDPPHDPILLKRVEGDIYEILAQWDLTPLEREAMRLAIS